MHIPLELRFEIYSYLIPDAEVPAAFHQLKPRECGHHKWPQGDPPFLRRDEEPCTPAMLRVNHQIHIELMEMWYSKATFHMNVEIGGLGTAYLLGQRYDPKQPLPPDPVGRIAHLKVAIYVDGGNLNVHKGFPLGKTVWRSFVGAPNKLQTLDISTIGFDCAMMEALRNEVRHGRDARARRQVKRLLKPTLRLFHVRGFPSAEMNFVPEKHDFGTPEFRMSRYWSTHGWAWVKVAEIVEEVAGNLNVKN
ncbi:hypothetical protein BT63DRAFT_264421 [Microthyrium microscopicum]|uniref:Uncharacterized protein n=1 Tax=Microthyrium microscopicum TaxID=703497 RepID=A0A6A6UBE7_9PEZI|nr:hypothetical protein BT63DRAFT_264421 [Microthyrium microscopicum]